MNRRWRVTCATTLLMLPTSTRANLWAATHSGSAGSMDVHGRAGIRRIGLVHLVVIFAAMLSASGCPGPQGDQL
jgi:hypothetical protein